MKKFIFITFFIGCIYSNAQVGINTSTPNAATILDIDSNSKGILIPRLTDTERDTYLADNNISTDPPIGVVNTALTIGTLIFNTTQNRFEFWDGKLWRQLFVPTSSTSGNDGVVKINSGANNSKPVISLNSDGSRYGIAHIVLFTVPLVFADSPTTSWPETTIPYPGLTSNIYISEQRIKINVGVKTN